MDGKFSSLAPLARATCLGFLKCWQDIPPSELGHEVIASSPWVRLAKCVPSCQESLTWGAPLTGNAPNFCASAESNSVRRQYSHHQGLPREHTRRAYAPAVAVWRPADAAERRLSYPPPHPFFYASSIHSSHQVELDEAAARSTDQQAGGIVTGSSIGHGKYPKRYGKLYRWRLHPA